MIRKAINIRKHLEKSRKDKDAKYRLILIESRIHRLARYYRKTQRLPAKWKYDAKTASALVTAWSIFKNNQNLVITFILVDSKSIY